MGMINKKNKKAWLRIVEAFLAILIVLAAVLTTMSRTKPVNFVNEEEVYAKQRQILDVIVKNDSLRENVIQNNTQEIKDFISGVIPKNWNFAISICELNDVCYAETPNDRDIYSTEAMVSSTLIEYNPRKIKFFVWMK